MAGYDRPIKMVEKACSVRLTQVDNEFIIEGDPEKVQQARRILLELIGTIGDGFNLTVDDVRSVIDFAISRNATAPPDVSIPVFGKKKTIAPKSTSQKQYIESIRQYDVVVGIGPAGTGKTYLAMAMAVSAFLKKEVSRIVLARPAVEAGEKLGFLPGDLAEKVSPYLRPLYDALYDMMEVERANHLMARGDIEVVPLAFMRGRTLNDSFVILDEAQNTTSEQMKMFLTRLGFRSKAVITGDITQTDLPPERVSGLIEIQEILKGIPGIDFVYFDEQGIIRHRLVQAVVRAYEQHDERMKKRDGIRANLRMQ